MTLQHIPQLEYTSHNSTKLYTTLIKVYKTFVFYKKKKRTQLFFQKNITQLCTTLQHKENLQHFRKPYTTLQHFTILDKT